MEPKAFFLQPTVPTQRQYEALRAFYAEGLSALAAAAKYGLTPSYFGKLRYEFACALKGGLNPFFQHKKTGPKKPFTDQAVIEVIVALRKQNYSIVDIKAALVAQGKSLSLEAIDNILKSEGFAPLPKRTRSERLSIKLPAKIEAPPSVPLELVDEEFSTEKGAAPLIFLPLLEKLNIIPAIKNSGYPSTSVLSDISSVLSFVALKILGNERLSHDATWNLDRGLGFFAGLNVLPKSSTLSTYSYMVQRPSNRKLLESLSRIFQDTEAEAGEFNLDFKTIPHWGEESILEKNWLGTRSKAIKSLLSLIVQSPGTGYLSYTDAEIRHRNQSGAVLEFVDFWKTGRGIAPKMLIFDSKFTTYENLSRLNQSPEKIKFLTIRRRGKALLKQIPKIPEAEWQKIYLPKGINRKNRTLKVHDGTTRLRKYTGQVRQVILTDHGREQPAFLITNDLDIDIKEIVLKYARRWLVEQEIAEQIAFFHLNQPSSSIVVKVDFDLTISLLVHNLYRYLTNNLPGFEHCNVPTIYRTFLENGANIKVQGKEVTISLKKKTHLPILFQLPWLNEKTHISWMGINLTFHPGTTS